MTPHPFCPDSTCALCDTTISGWAFPRYWLYHGQYSPRICSTCNMRRQDRLRSRRELTLATAAPDLGSLI